MLSARDKPPEERGAAGLPGFAIDKSFFTNPKGILLEVELVFGVIVVFVFVYDAFKIYQAEMAPSPTQGDQ
ncbi:CKLF-like MARVEL transmembrane domain-containing protein 5 isoform X4 [Macrotis lagotis]|uniref:CKLF-like MARVEL transmembrane domain-containing protein 5 isoform X4 n=1 Tax=Macrotis lagotis TaxID=92651 RepID=UPI003D684599